MSAVVILEAFLGLILIFSSLGVILAKKPVYSCLFFLLTLLTLATLYIELFTEFIGLLQVLVYGGAILVLFMFVIVLFQDAHEQIVNLPAMSSYPLLFMGGISLIGAFSYFCYRIFGFENPREEVREGFGSIHSIGKTLYLDYFFPFEVASLMILVALIGALYIGRKAR
ncbi:NADH-quinone oxidoreductase subunit J [Estrella lausannensis]|uniref:NADH-quinone oxidoreductase subunit J n=1 Tax=Estrella lausannensis TaxID=483423 RepID=A0A0H5DQL6_9BACT|nr:NADH-quinone oxidoreductase subunit J [Estrella lausannensis]CRX38951.1 NADH-quinone oxidoreductase subunit J [Estrella lausannensis]